jgi:hypothetical protein
MPWQYSLVKAFSSEVETGSREENALKQKSSKISRRSRRR